MCNFIYAKGSLKGLFHKICGFQYVQFCMCKSRFKGTVPWDFRLQDFSCISLSQNPEFPISAISNYFTNSQKYSQLKVHHRDRWHWGQIYHRCHWYQWQIASGVIDTGVIDNSGELPLVSLTPVANLLRYHLSLTPVANLLRYHWHWWQIFKDGRKFFFQFTNPQTLGLNLQSQIRKFLRYASSPILYLRIYFHWSAKPKFTNFVGPANCKTTNATLAEGSQM